MALVLADRVLETTTTAGSGTITLAGAEPGYQSFSAVGDGNQTYYTIAGDTEWEVGVGTYTASGTTLSRDTVLSSSNSNAKVTFSAGTKKVFVTYPSEKSVNFDVSGNISLSSAVISGVASPTADSDAATKLYVDSLVAAGITYHSPVKYEVPNTVGNLNATYNNGTAGVSATLTNAGSLVPFIPDGVTASISDRVLVYSQTNAFENGVYTVTVVGDGSTAWVLTRASDADTYALKSPNSLGEGDAFFVTSGNTGAGETYLCNTTGAIDFGSTAISFVQISSAQVYKAGNGISLTNTTISLATPVAVGNGGTGTSSTPTNGQLLIGNGSGYTLSTLTAGSGVSITNSAGSITLSATGLGGTVTAVTATGPLASSGGTTPDISIANSTGTGSVVLDQGATISSATITAALSASITTITGTSANITTVTGTTTTFSSGTISQLGATSATVTTLSGTNVTYSSGTVSQLAATSATIATVSGTNVTYSNGNFTSATVTTVSGTNLSYGSATITSGNLTFSSTAQRITGDMSNATQTNRLAFQSSTTNGNTIPILIPNGTATISGFTCWDNSDITNASFFQFASRADEARIVASISGTGTYRPIAFQTGGSERMRLDTSGNLLIGNTSTLQSERLQIKGATLGGTAGNTSYNTVFHTPDVSNTTRLSVFDYRVSNGTSHSSSRNVIQRRVDGTDMGFVGFDSNFTSIGWGTTVAVAVDSSGNVGIGTASPGTKLQVAGGVSAEQVQGRYFGFGTAGFSLDGTTVNDYGITYTTISSTFNTVLAGFSNIKFATSQTERMRIDASGNVGIGTASPSSKLEVNGGAISVKNSGGGEGGEILLYNPDNSTVGMVLDVSGANVGRIFSTSNNSLLQLGQLSGTGGVITAYTAGSERLRIDSSGNVGIGTSSPGYLLDVQANPIRVAATSSGAGYVQYGKSGTATNNWHAGSEGDGTFRFWNGNYGSGTERIQITSAGYVGIGRTPSVTLDVNGLIYSRYTAAWGAAVLYMPGGYAQFGKDNGHRTDIVNTGGLDANNPFWIGYQWTPPDVILNSSSQNSFPRTSFYFNYSTVTNPSNMAWNMYTGNNNGVPISWNVGTETAGTFNIITSGNTRFTIGASGQFGIAGANYGTSGQVFTSNGSGSAPSWQSVSGLPTVNVTSSTAISAVAGNHYILRGASATVTLPSSPAAGNVVWVTVANSLTVNKVARNGVNIQGLAEDLILDSQYAAVQFRYSDATMGWVFC